MGGNDTPYQSIIVGLQCSSARATQDLHGADHVQGEHHGGGQVQVHRVRHGPVQGD